MQWISTDRTTMKKLTSSVDKYIALLANKVFALCVHYFIGRAQSDYLRTRKENLQQDEAINHFIRFCRELFVCYTGCSSMFPLGK